MRKSLCSVLLASFLLLLAAPRAFAWGNAGHEAVACVAWQHLDQATKDRVYALLTQVPYRPSPDPKLPSIPGFPQWSAGLPAGLTVDQQHMYVFMRAATYPDTLKRTFLHDTDRPPATGGDSNLGFSDTFSHGYWHFVAKSFGTPSASGKPAPPLPKTCVRATPPKQVTALPPTPTPNAATEITLLSAAIASTEPDPLKAYDLVWLEHMVGDIHQPMHSAERYVDGIDDLGGNCVAISVHAPISSHYPHGAPEDLHAFWDDIPGQGDPMEDTAIAVTYAGTLAPAPAAQAAITDPNTWAEESYDMAFRDAYTGPIGPGFGAPTPYAITPGYYQTAAADVAVRVALAGARLANLITADLK
jgi:hypothetical protein